MKSLLRGAFVATLSVVITTGVAQANLLTNGDFGTGDLTGWGIASGGSAQTTIDYDGSEGQPAGSALLDRNIVTLDDNKDVLYQIVPVTIGSQYKVDADWKGDLHVGGDGRNWAEVMVAFIADGSPITDGTTFIDDWILYKKASAGGPHEPPTTGFDWESILDSPDGGPVDGVFTATANYLVLGFNLGGRDEGDSRHTLIGPGYYYVDNASVTLVPEPAGLLLLAFGAVATLGRRRC